MINLKRIISWTARVAAAIIMMQTLYFKFSGAEESVYIFSTIGIEPWGRIVTGILELVASVLILINATAWIGALLGLGLMAGAIVTHLTILGVTVKEDGGYLFLLAVSVAICCTIVLADNRKQMTIHCNRVLKKNH